MSLQVFRFLFASRSKGKAGDIGRDYAITQPEPLLHFALCSGNLSDPSVSKSPNQTSFLIFHATHIEGLGFKATRFL